MSDVRIGRTLLLKLGHGISAILINAITGSARLPINTNPAPNHNDPKSHFNSNPKKFFKSNGTDFPCS